MFVRGDVRGWVRFSTWIVACFSMFSVIVKYVYSPVQRNTEYPLLIPDSNMHGGNKHGLHGISHQCLSIEAINIISVLRIHKLVHILPTEAEVDVCTCATCCWLWAPGSIVIEINYQLPVSLKVYHRDTSLVCNYIHSIFSLHEALQDQSLRMP